MASHYEELKALVVALNQADVPYALCGGVAMAIHGYVRASIDIDLLVQRSDLERIFSVAAPLGYGERPKVISSENGWFEAYRCMKAGKAGEDPVMLELFIVTPALGEIWKTREHRKWQEGTFWVVSREGLIQLKSRRSAGWDLADVARIRQDANMSPKAITNRLRRASEITELCLSLAKAGTLLRPAEKPEPFPRTSPPRS